MKLDHSAALADAAVIVALFCATALQVGGVLVGDPAASRDGTLLLFAVLTYDNTLTLRRRLEDLERSR